MEISHGCQDGGGAEYRWFLALAGGAVAKETSAEIASRNSDNAMPFPKGSVRFGFTFVGDKVRRFRSGAARVRQPAIGSFAVKRVGWSGAPADRDARRVLRDEAVDSYRHIVDRRPDLAGARLES